eukprot:CAMPEP_0169148260 /NCGR_PEP_ID=MMETSP1015-20121227/48751_1 /TAXON_ID=342587 /ORGANISM="Karlodinium micrum, Strain CCMP2283" /LENGTH=40 /DNA_ID= /DNA_START= /DNA_END= /DNA_ORIENTATION=
MTMLTALVPETFVPPSIWPHEDAEAFFPIEHILAAILPSI